MFLCISLPRSRILLGSAYHQNEWLNQNGINSYGWKQSTRRISIIGRLYTCLFYIQVVTHSLFESSIQTCCLHASVEGCMCYIENQLKFSWENFNHTSNIDQNKPATINEFFESFMFLFGFLLVILVWVAIFFYWLLLNQLGYECINYKQYYMHSVFYCQTFILILPMFFFR